jgi:type I restriction enzyme S subunit
MPESISEGIPYVSPKDFYGVNDIDFENAKQISRNDFEDLAQKMKPQRGDIVFARYATIGTIRLVETDRDFLASYSCAIIRPDDSRIYPKYLYFSLLSNSIKEESLSYANSNTQSNVGIDSIQRFKLCVPNMSIQLEIVSYLEKVCDRIESAIEKKQAIVTKLTEYKKSLIYEAVTGKMEV